MDEHADLLAGYRDESGKFARFPGRKQKKKQQLMLSFFLEQFDPDKTYSEKEVNELLNQHHSFNDPASLRRMMIGHQMLARTKDGQQYWVVGEKTENQP